MFFFFNDTATTEIYTLPYTTLFRSAFCVCLGGGWRADCKRKMRVLVRSEEHTSELQSRLHLVCRLLLEKKKKPRCQRCHHCAPTTTDTRDTQVTQCSANNRVA